MLHILHIQNNGKLFTGNKRRLKKSIGDEVKEVGMFFNSN